MRRKTLRGGRATASAMRVHPIVRTIPVLVRQVEDDAAVAKISIESNHDLRKVREVGSKGNMDEGSTRNPHDSLGHDYIFIDFLDRTICMCCNKGGEVLVCGERGCPVTLHAKCIFSEPKFDDMGNFYCPYCWYKRAVAEVQELRKKALIAKKDLSNFLAKNAVTSDKLVQKDEEAERKELKELNGSCLDHHDRQGNDIVRGQPLQTVRDQQKEIERVTANADQHGVAVEEGKAHANALVAYTGDSRHYREEKTPVHIELAHKSANREKFDVNNISETHETRFVEGKEKIEPEDPIYNYENGHERIVVEAKPLRAFHLGEYTGRRSSDIEVDQEKQEYVAVYVDNDSGSEALSMKKIHAKQRARKTGYPQGVSSVRKSLSLKSKTEGKSASYQNEEVTTSKTSRQLQRSSKQGKNLTSSTGKRKRLNWTDEEENTLKVGVLRFSMENRNIPWRKILKFGCHVFDNNRTPADLKDKWKNITAKEGWKKDQCNDSMAELQSTSEFGS